MALDPAPQRLGQQPQYGHDDGSSGSFEVERTVVDLAGTDAIVFRGVRDGQVCRGVVNY